MLDLYAELKQGYQSDAWFANRNNLQDLKLLDGLWWKGDRLVIPNVSRVRTALLWDYHDSPYAGHLGVNKTLHNMQRSFWWQGMFSDINGYIRTCVTCQRSKRSPVKPSGLLQPLHIPHGPWDSVSTDFVTGLPETKAGYDAILVSVDRLTKYVHIVPTTTKCTAKTWADCSFSMCSAIMVFPWKSFLTEVHNLLASTTKRSLIACASHGTCPQHFTLRLMVKQSA